MNSSVSVSFSEETRNDSTERTMIVAPTSQQGSEQDMVRDVVAAIKNLYGLKDCPLYCPTLKIILKGNLPASVVLAIGHMLPIGGPEIAVATEMGNMVISLSETPAGDIID